MNVKIQISEPYELKIPNEDHVLKGCIVGRCSGPDKPNWKGEYVIVTLQPSLHFKRTEISQLVVAPRHTGELIDEIFSGSVVVVGIARIKRGATINPGTVFRESDVEYFAIGTIQATTNRIN